MLEHNTPLKTYLDELKDPAVSNKLMQIIDGLKEDQCVLLKPSDEPFLRTQLVYEIINKKLNIILFSGDNLNFRNDIAPIRFTPEFHHNKMLQIEQQALDFLPMEKTARNELYITEMMQDYYLRNVHHKYIVHCVTKCWRVR